MHELGQQTCMFVAPTGAPGPGPYAPLGIVGVGPNKCTGRHVDHAVAGSMSTVISSLLLHIPRIESVPGFPASHAERHGAIYVMARGPRTFTGR